MNPTIRSGEVIDAESPRPFSESVFEYDLCTRVLPLKGKCQWTLNPFLTALRERAGHEARVHMCFGESCCDTECAKFVL